MVDMINDNRLGVLQRRGGYLYDKGENDELFYVIGYPQPIYKYILSYTCAKVKKIIKSFFIFWKVYQSRKKC